MSYKNILMVGYPDSVSKEVFESAEQQIGVKLPPPFYELIKNYYRGRPTNDELLIVMPGGLHKDVNGIGAFLSFNSRHTINIVGAYLFKPEHQPQDERFVPFAVTGNGDYFYFFY